jgi:hypothetical protein
MIKIYTLVVSVFINILNTKYKINPKIASIIAVV